MEILAAIAAILYFLPGILGGIIVLGLVTWGIIASIRYEKELRRKIDESN